MPTLRPPGAPVYLGTGAVDETWKTRRRWSRGRTHGGTGVPAARANGSVADLAGSVFHGLSTGAIPQTNAAAVGRRWETRGRIVGKQHRHGTNPGATCPASVRNIAPFNSAQRTNAVPVARMSSIPSRRRPRKCAFFGCRACAVFSCHRHPLNRDAELRFPPFAHRASGSTGDRRRGRSVENARPRLLCSRSGCDPIAAGTRRRDNIALFIWPRRLRRTAPVLLTCTVVRRRLPDIRSTRPVTPQ